MTTITLTLTSACAGGNHLTFAVSGDATATVRAVLDDVTAPLDMDDALAFVRIITRMAKKGRTLAQLRTLLQGGVTVTV